MPAAKPTIPAMPRSAPRPALGWDRFDRLGSGRDHMLPFIRFAFPIRREPTRLRRRRNAGLCGTGGKA
ncbi:hypothetical protein OO17_14760 [Rhodopseudomonas palustris]|uniref:Uncharacterized protein n=1 Tax=Rhodopseudomonas palustris TaxID=1076 RepID=A0A0D7ELM3_RHOPL|nr:hypothetical protein OO17_14760 [Rhodopseudomonas palustris]